jgi:hypothetical protein
MGRVPHLHLLDTDSGKVRDLFEGTGYELTRTEPDANQFDISPDGRRIVFAFDPAPEKRIDGRFALAELELKSGASPSSRRTADWDFGAPRYSPDGERIAFTASHQGRKHTMPEQLAVWDREAPHGSVSAEWDHEVQRRCTGKTTARPCCWPSRQGRRHLWRFDLPDRRAEVVVPAAGCRASTRPPARW